MNELAKLAESIEENGILAKGKAELLAHLNNEITSKGQAILAKCYECSGYYVDGKEICTIPSCPLYPFHPYNPKRRKSRVMSEDQKMAAKERFAKYRSDKE